MVSRQHREALLAMIAGGVIMIEKFFNGFSSKGKVFDFLMASKMLLFIDVAELITRTTPSKVGSVSLP